MRCLQRKASDIKLRFVVTLPIVEEKLPQLAKTFHLAKHRFLRLEQKLRHYKGLEDEYKVKILHASSRRFQGVVENNKIAHCFRQKIYINDDLTKKEVETQKKWEKFYKRHLLQQEDRTEEVFNSDDDFNERGAIAYTAGQNFSFGETSFSSSGAEITPL